MKELINTSLRKKLRLSHREPSLNLSLNKDISSFSSEKKILFNHKSSLETLLIIVKNFQLKYLSLKESKKKDKNHIKQMIISLKDSLNLMLQEKNKQLNYINKKYENNKKKVKNRLFPPSQETNKEGLVNNIKIEYNKDNSFIIEKNQLQLLNFQIQNEIEKTNFLIEQKSQINSYIKSIPFFFETNKEIFCNNNYEITTKISELLNEIVRGVRKKFIVVVKEKMEKELEINGISLQINYIKDSIDDFKLNGCKKFIETEDIIPEESREYTKSIITNQSKRNSISSINKNVSKKRTSINSKSTINIYNKEKRKIKKDKFQNNYFYSNKINKNLFNDLNNNQVNSYLNMNINVNINLNNNNFIQNSFNSSSDSNNIVENNEKNEQYEMDFNDNNKIIITPIITNENIDELNNKNNILNTDSLSNNNDSFILDINDK